MTREEFSRSLTRAREGRRRDCRGNAITPRYAAFVASYAQTSLARNFSHDESIDLRALLVLAPVVGSWARRSEWIGLPVCPSWNTIASWFAVLRMIESAA